MQRDFKINFEDETEKRRRVVMILSMIQYVLLAMGFVLFIVPGVNIIGFIMFIGGIVMTIAVNAQKNKYSAFYKDGFVKNILAEKFTELVFEPEHGISEEQLDETEMIRLGNRFESNDYISGRYRGLNFEQSDVCIQNVTHNGKHTYTTTYFEGRWMIFDFNKKFTCDLQVREKSFSYAKKSGGWFSEKPRMKEIELENAAFSDDFEVYAADEHEAFYILTPHMMERIIELSRSISGELMLCFVGNKLHVAVNNGEDAFEPPVFGKIDYDEARKDVVGDIDMITSFIDDLKLYENIYRD